MAAPIVVGVNVAVVETVASDDDDGVADPRPDLAKGVHLRVVGVEEVHDLVAQFAEPVFARALRARARRSTSAHGATGSRRARTREHNASKSNKSPVPPESTTPACFRTASCSGVMASASFAASARRAQEFDQGLLVRSGAFGRGARDRQDGALDGAHDGLARQYVRVVPGRRRTRAQLTSPRDGKRRHQTAQTSGRGSRRSCPARP